MVTLWEKSLKICESLKQAWLRKNVPDFITIKEWPPYRLYLNPLDYAIWGYLEAKACEKPHESIKSLKKAIKKVWDEMPDDIVNNEWLIASLDASKRVSMQKEDILINFLLLRYFLLFLLS
uniref:Uncharacterized protein n=1 Tax=Acrobeloides nanus TaxID=290746 RepID=A0A914EHS9_9BILA